MPRPGPRPYECVRRAWHSDRHQPIRGSIISQIFRVVTEAHSSTTRKNREWQEKLPTVVIRAEEIMYSKANSEVEYLDPDTLWDRLNDAIDTIIRKEETVETGEYLQPCIEAALVLGCVPVKASRSERLSNPRSYLPHCVQKQAQRPSALSEKTIIDRQPIHHTPIAPSNRLCFANPAIQSSSTAVNHVPRLHPNIVHNVMPTVAVEPNSRSMDMGSVYSLSYGSKDHQNLSSQTGIHMRQNQNPGNVIVGTPVGWSSQPSHICTRELFPSVVGACNSDKPSQDNQADASVMTCDLSLRLGRNSDPQEHVGDPGSSSSQNPRTGFLPRQSSGDHHIEPCSSRWVSSEGEVLRKRKISFSNDVGEGSISQQQQRRPGQFPGHFTWKGL